MKEIEQYKGLRLKLSEELRRKGITDENILTAIGNVPRHVFMESSFIGYSYKDKAFPIGAGQTISQPFTVAFQTQLLQVQPNEKILEIGTGSGYQTAILVELKAKVFSLERKRELFLKSKILLSKLGYNAHLNYGDGYEGMSGYGPFDKILVTAAAPEIPVNLLAQLKWGGLMVLPIGPSNSQVMTVLKKIDEEHIEKTEHGQFIFVPLIKGIEK